MFIFGYWAVSHRGIRLVDYHLARLTFLRDIGKLDLSAEGLLQSDLTLPQPAPEPLPESDDLPTPDELF